MSDLIKRAKNFYKKYGFSRTVKKIVNYIWRRTGARIRWEYQPPRRRELKQWRKEEFSYRPKLSILIPMYQTPPQFMKELLDSIQAQIYDNWELCLADGSGEDTEAYAVIKERMAEDDRIHYKRLAQNGGISENTNAALAMAAGEYIILCDHDDLITVDAFYHVIKALNQNPEIDIIYTDEDKIDGKRHFDPFCKPDLNMDFLRGGNYICHMFVARREIAEKVRFKKEYDGAQDFDFIFRCIEESHVVYHIPRILYHWRCHINSTAGNSESKTYAYDAGRNAVQAHLDRSGIKAVVRKSKMRGYYFVDYEQIGQPKVSLITGKHLSGEVIESISYPNLEVITTEDASIASINQAVRDASGEILFFLDERITSLDKGCFERLLSPHQREDLASTFAKVTDQEHMLYSAGVIVGIRGYYGRAFYGADEDNIGYANHLNMMEDLSASDLCCVMMKKSALGAIGGFDETLETTSAIVDAYLRMGERGDLHLFEPSARARIFAVDASGGYENKDFLLKKEDEEEFQRRWQNFHDPSYNPQFYRDTGGYEIQKHPNYEETL